MSLRAKRGVSFLAMTERIINTPLAPLGEGNDRGNGQRHARTLVEGSQRIDKGNEIKKAARSSRIFG